MAESHTDAIHLTLPKPRSRTRKPRPPKTPLQWLGMRTRDVFRGLVQAMIADQKARERK